jgi:uncharacterized protein (TIGR03437 family)
MQVAALANAFQIQPARAGAPAIAGVVNADATQNAILPGSFSTVFGQNLAGAQLSLNDVPAQVVFSNATQVNFIVPGNFTPGPATLRLTGAAGAAMPIMLQIDTIAPTIMGVSASGAPGAGDTIQLLVTGLDAAVAASPNSRLRVVVSGFEMPIQQVQPLGGGAYVLHVTVSQSFASAEVPVVVWTDRASSAPLGVTIR